MSRGPRTPYVARLPRRRIDVHVRGSGRYPAEAFLLDAPSDELYGGTGKTFDWARAQGRFRRRSFSRAAWTPINVAEAIREAQPWGVDACSRLEIIARAARITRRWRQFVKAALGGRMTSQPDARGHFGPYGGRYVPEVLMAPLEETRAGVSRGARTIRTFQAELEDLLANYAGRPTPLYSRQAAERNPGRRADLHQARRPAAHRRAQNQQLPRAGAARAAHGQAAHHRRDRRGPARRRNGYGLRAVRPRMHRLHGRRGHAAAAPERVSHAAAGREGRRRRYRQPDAQGRHQRSHARLGDERRRARITCSGRRSARIRIR